MIELFVKLISHQQKKAVRQEKAMMARPPSRARTTGSCRPGSGSFVAGSSGLFVFVSIEDSSLVGSTVEGSNVEGSSVEGSISHGSSVVQIEY